MNRIFKTLALFLLVSTVSFVYAQEEFDKSDDGNGMMLTLIKNQMVKYLLLKLLRTRLLKVSQA